MFPKVTATRKTVAATAAASLGLLSLVGLTGARASAAPARSDIAGTFTASVVLSGASLSHKFVADGKKSSEPLSHPDDITRLGHDFFVGFQNGVGAQGEANSNGNLDSTIVEFTASGAVVGQWDVLGKADGVTADPATGLVFVTVNEDANSSLYTIIPVPNKNLVTHYRYNKPLPHNGGTDAISFYRGNILISASAPGTTGAPPPQPYYPAVYSVTLNPANHVATVTPVFFDEDGARVVNTGEGGHTSLALTDPDSNAVVPSFATRFAGDFELTSQGDLQQIYVTGAGSARPTLSVLNLSQAVDDTIWPSGTGVAYASDTTNDTVDAITGPFPSGSPMVVATPCGANSAPANCSTANYLATLNPFTGVVNQVTVTGASFVPQGALMFVPQA
jgi:hypothetical protein